MTYPILYESTMSDFNTEGLGVLSDTLTATIVRDANLIPALTLTYPLNGKLTKEIHKDMIIASDMGYKDEEKHQMFRISNITKSNAGLTIVANHVAGDLAGERITSQVTNANSTPTDAWNALQSAFVYDIPRVKFYSDVVKVANTNWEVSDDPVTTLMMGADQAGDKAQNTMQALYGVDWYFNNYNLKALNNKRNDTGILIKWKQNLSNISDEESSDDYYDGIMPFAKYMPDQVPEGTDTSSDFDGQGDVQYVGTGGATTYDSPYKGHNEVGKVQNGTYYHVLKTASENTVNDDTWYMLDNNQWIDEHFFTFDKSGAYIVNKTSAQGHIAIPDDSSDSEGLIVDFIALASVTYYGAGKVAVWDSPFSGHSHTGKYIGNGSQQQITRKATTQDGKTWYCINQEGTSWVDGQYITLQKGSDFTLLPTHGYVIFRSKPTFYSTPDMTHIVNWNPTLGIKYSIYSQSTNASGVQLYEIEVDKWVKADDAGVDFKTAGTVQPNEDNDRKALVQATGRIPIYSKPDGTSATGQYLSMGQQCTITSQADNNGMTWYEIGENQWVDANYLNFDASDDVAPGDNDSDDSEGIEVEEQTVMLDEKYILANTAVHTEHPKIQTVDLSEYNVRDQDKLREVALAYMKEYRIGIMPVSMTIDYKQMYGKYAALTEVDLYDIVSIQFDELDIAVKAKVNSVTWDCLLNRLTTITIGQMPIDYDHALGQYIDNQQTKTKNYVSKKSNHLFGQLHDIMNLKDADRKAGLLKLAKQLDIPIYDGHQDNDISILSDIVSSINSAVDDSKSLIESMGGVIHASPSWQNPQELYAETSDGGRMIFTSNGLEFLGRDGIQRSAIDAYGRVNAENINAGTIEALTVKSASIEGELNISSKNGTNYAVMGADYGFNYKGGGYDIGLGPAGGLNQLNLGGDNWQGGNGIYTSGHIICGNFLRVEGVTLTGALIQKLINL